MCNFAVANYVEAIYRKKLYSFFRQKVSSHESMSTTCFFSAYSCSTKEIISRRKGCKTVMKHVRNIFLYIFNTKDFTIFRKKIRMGLSHNISREQNTFTCKYVFFFQRGLSNGMLDVYLRCICLRADASGKRV